MPAENSLHLLRIAKQPALVAAAVKIALVVGTILNAINQGSRLVDGLPLSWLHVLLNYLVPFCVSSYSAARNQQRHQKDTRQ